MPYPESIESARRLTTGAMVITTSIQMLILDELFHAKRIPQ
jgi:hypothetical protein